MKHTCQLCGATKDVTAHSDYVGGIGYVTHYLCRDFVACRRRFDEQSGLPTWDYAQHRWVEPAGKWVAA